MERFNSVFLFACLYAVFNVAGAAIIKGKLLSHKIQSAIQFIHFLIEPKIILALCLIVVSMFFSVKSLSLSSFSAVIPLLTATNFLLTVAVGALYFRDKLSLSGYAGIALILVGVFMLTPGTVE